MIDSSHWVLTLACPDRPGIVHAVTGAIASAQGNITELQQFSSIDSGRFFMRVQVQSGFERSSFEESVRPLAAYLNATWHLDFVGRPRRTLVLASRAGHCLNDLLYRQRAGQLPVSITRIMANHPDLASLAAFYGVPFDEHVVLPETKADFERALLAVVEAEQVELVVLARFMQVLSPGLCAALAGRAINIHHSFLPGFKGARPYHQAHERGVKLIGATAHFVTANLDEGPIIEQAVERVDHAHTPEALAEIGRDVERLVLSRAVRWFAEDRVLLTGHRTVVFT